MPSTTDQHPSVGGPTSGRRQLEDERDFLLRSIEDLDSELAVGDITGDDYLALRDSYMARAANVIRALADSPGLHEPHPMAVGAPDDVHRLVDERMVQSPASATRRRPWLVWVALAMFAAAAVVLVGAALGVRLPGETATGNVSLSKAQEVQRTVAQAESLEASGQAAQALELYRQVLAQDATQEQALAESGWLEYEAGIQDANGTLLSKGQQDEQTAERSDPGAYAPHLYLGSMLLVESQAAAAATEFGRFLASSPPAGVVQTAWSFIVKAYTQAGETVPAAPLGVHG